jgi:leucyl-tRNA synthetase
MFDLGQLPPEVGEEPFRQLRLHGWILRDGAKMSKSRGNVVNPDEYVRQYGADVMRLQMLFAGSYTEGGDFRDAAISGIVRFYRRVWEWVTGGAAANLAPAPADEDQARRAIHKTIKRVSDDLPMLGFNTAIAALMGALNTLRECRLSAQVHQEMARLYVLILAPLAPFLAEELWEQLGGSFSVHRQAWPKYDPALVVDEMMTLPIQINGKLRARIEVAAEASEDEVVQLALAAPEVQRHLAGQTVVRTFYAAGRLLSIVSK